MEIVGVVGDEKVDTLDREVTPIVYFDQAQSPDATYSLLVRSLDEPQHLIRTVTREIHAIEPQWPVYAARTMSEVISESMPVLLRRYLVYLLGAFALIAAFVAAVGVYGVIAFSVAQRRQEIGVRLTLGAARGRIAGLVIGQGMRLAALGVAVGLAVAAGASRLARGLLFGVSPADPGVLAGATAVVTLAALAACVVPALRAVRVDPSVALRSE
jgi:ABC-type antimicrobial peptide transport system permease subunit